MRRTHTCILRLLFDSNEPQQLRGSLHSIADDSDHTFVSAEALLALLREMGREQQPWADSSMTLDKEEN